MKSVKPILFSTTLAVGFGIFLGTTDAHADSLYTVKAGDTLSTISYQFSGDTSLIETIAQENGIADINLIYEGEQLTIRTNEENSNAQTVTTEAAPAAPVATPVTEVATSSSAPTTASTTFTSSAAKEWIAQKESSGSYTATNGRYIGRYQLDATYLNGDYSVENQERVADNYVAGRYGSWEAAQAFWIANGWY